MVGLKKMAMATGPSADVGRLRRTSATCTSKVMLDDAKELERQVSMPTIR